MADDLNVESPAAAFARQARMEARVESALRWAIREFLADVEAMAARDGSHMAAGSVAQTWTERMSVEALSAFLPLDVAHYVSEMQALADTPDQAYDTAMAVLDAAREREWSTEVTRDVLSMSLRADSPRVALTAAASPRRQRARDAFDAAFGAQGGMSWYDVAKRDARTAVTGLDGLLSTEAMRRQGFKFKQWVARHDERTRSTHAAADGQRVPVDASFTVGGVALNHPGDRRGPAGEVINCRCVTVGASSAAAGTTALPFLAP
uniref:Portal protein n=2 Tax=unclassified bacterial viruses TaxID=12333 RepID=A0AAU7J7Y7_9VIRU